MRITSLETRLVPVNHRGDWLHVLLHTDNGLTGFGEASHGGFGPNRDHLVEHVLLHQIQTILLDSDPTRVVATMHRLNTLADGLAAATAVSATEQALHDLAGKRLGISSSELFGDGSPQSIPLYANFNRAVRERSPESFARTALEATAAGFTAIKLAPFDGIDQQRIREPRQRALLQRGLDCVAAVRDAVGNSIDVMVDCHSSFDPETAISVARELAALGVTWFEEPLPLHNIAEHVALRRNVHRLGMELVGGELLFGIGGFYPWIAADAFDVIMPDVKHCGGMAALRAIGELAAVRGIFVAPHNPSGPVSTIVSGHALAGLATFRSLEIAFGEVPWRSDVVDGAEQIESGSLVLPAGPGHGIESIHDPNANDPVRNS